MPNLRRVSGQAVLAVFRSFGFEIHSQRGSHVRIRRMGPHGERQTLTIPNHSELDTGTLRAVIRQASRYIALDELLRHFRD